MRLLRLLSITALIVSEYAEADTSGCSTNGLNAITPAELQDLRKALLRGYALPQSQKRSDLSYRQPHSARFHRRQTQPEGRVDTGPVVHDNRIIQLPPDNRFILSLDPTATADIANTQQTSINGQRHGEISPPPSQASKLPEQQLYNLGIGLINKKCNVAETCPGPKFQKAYQSAGGLCLIGGDPSAVYQQAFDGIQSFTLQGNFWAGALVTKHVQANAEPSGTAVRFKPRATGDAPLADRGAMYINFRVKFPTTPAPAYLNHQGRYEPIAAPIDGASPTTTPQIKRSFTAPDTRNIEPRATTSTLSDNNNADECEPASKLDFDATIFQLWRTVFMPRVERGETTHAEFVIAAEDKMSGSAAPPSGLQVAMWVSQGQADFVGMHSSGL